ncbi:MAG: methyltransferase, partial [Thermoplasmata archaeon]|nr:methyltransferase [Thermoplasmata archaeon]
MIEEGKVKILSSCKYKPSHKGPGKKSIGFYNPAWKLDRDVEVLFAKYAYKNKSRKFLDGLASTGIRGIRIAKELDEEIEMDINDISHESYKIIKKNIELNKVNANALNENVCAILTRKKYDYIIIDPYGSPVKFIPCIFNGARKKTFVSITATDTATLCGIFKKACVRKYHSLPLRMQGMKEIALRILIGFIARNAASYDYSMLPLISYSHHHYFRIYGIIERGIKKADEIMKKIGWIYWDDGWKKSLFEEPPQKKFAGPLWTGNIFEDNALNFIKNLSEENKKLNKLIEIFKGENISIPY